MWKLVVSLSLLNVAVAQKCSCLGTNRQAEDEHGNITVNNKNWTVKYDGSYGEFCGVHAEPGQEDCTGNSTAAWCSAKWCYVDPCLCDGPTDIGESDYFLPTGGKKLFYSYEACGNADAYTSKRCPELSEADCNADADCIYADDACSVSTGKVTTARAAANCSALDFGSFGTACRCLGTNKQDAFDVNGAAFVRTDSIGNYPADYGTSCKTHAEPGAADCQGDSPAAWCSNQWCYVDPCTCSGPTDLGLSDYFSKTSDNKPLYYSYAVCGESSTYGASACEARSQANCTSDPDCQVVANGACGLKPESVSTGREASGCPPLDGHPSCRCTGENGQIATSKEGELVVVTTKEGFVGHNYAVTYGEACTAHDEPGATACQGNHPASWCLDSWCYIDPCYCDDTSIGRSDYFIATKNSKPLYYSYAACGGEDNYNAAKCSGTENQTLCEAQDKCQWTADACVQKVCSAGDPTCAQNALDAARDDAKCPASLFMEKCPCLGTNRQKQNRDGSVNVLIANYTGTYPGSYGEKCGVHAEPGAAGCQTETPDAWCLEEWCYVDPCFCEGPVDLGLSDYFPKGSDGKGLYYSYSACGSDDKYTAKKCAGSDDNVTCNADSDCAWAGDACGLSSAKVDTARTAEECDDLDFGSFGATCRCLGSNQQARFDVDGEAFVMLDKTGLLTSQYPATYGSSCQAHAEPGASACQGPNKASWCDTPWCYVDPCSCNGPNDLAVSDYFESTYTGKPLFYSYAACGSKNDYNTAKCSDLELPYTHETESKCNAEDECKWADNHCVTDLDKQSVGREEYQCADLSGLQGCKCTGANEQPVVVNGTRRFVVTNKEGFAGHEYPADYGEMCTPHAEPGADACKGPYPSPWCRASWCYVDPCSCNDNGIGLSDYFNTTTSGKPLYYSYATCGSADTYNAEKCAAKTSSAACGTEDECEWSSGECVVKSGESMLAAREDADCPTTTTVDDPDATVAPTPTSVHLSFKIANLVYADLVKNDTLVAEVKTAVKAAVADAAGSAILPEHVSVALSAGSVKVDSVIVPPEGASVTAVQETLKDEAVVTSLQASVIDKVQAIDGIEDVSSGGLSVTGYEATAPTPTTATTSTKPNDKDYLSGSVRSASAMLLVPLMVIVRVV